LNFFPQQIKPINQTEYDFKGLKLIINVHVYKWLNVK